MLRGVRALAVGVLLSAAVVASVPALSGATTATAGGYHVVVKPIFQTPGRIVYVTGTPAFGVATGFYATVCKNATVTATLTYYTSSGAVKTTSTVLGAANAIVAVPKPVLVPSDAEPTRINHQYAVVRASCQAGTGASLTTYVSEPDDVTVSGGDLTRATATSTPTTAPPATTATQPAAPASSTSSATNTVTPASSEPATTQLAQTGSNIAFMAAVGGMLIILGGLLLATDASWRRRALDRIRRR